MTVDSLEPSLRDPITGQSLRLVNSEEIQSLKRRLASSETGGAATQADGFVMTEDGQSAYPIVDGLIHLLPDDRILIASLVDVDPEPS